MKSDAGDLQMCFPKTLVDGEWRWVCPDRYHNVDDDEGSQYDNYVFEEGTGGDDSDSCVRLNHVCDENEHRERDYCIEYCDENPDSLACRPDSNSDISDICGANLFLNEDGKCIPDRECRSINVITTDKCHLKILGIGLIRNVHTD
jgi:hypothetical protein